MSNSWREMTEKEAEAALEKAPPVEGDAVIKAVDELAAAIYTVAAPGTVIDKDGDRHQVNAGEKVKLLNEGEYKDEPWLCQAEDLKLRLSGKKVGELKAGTHLALLEPDYKSQLKELAMRKADDADADNGVGTAG